MTTTTTGSMKFVLVYCFCRFVECVGLTCTNAFLRGTRKSVITPDWLFDGRWQTPSDVGTWAPGIRFTSCRYYTSLADVAVHCGRYMRCYWYVNDFVYQIKKLLRSYSIFRTILSMENIRTWRNNSHLDCAPPRIGSFSLSHRKVKLKISGVRIILLPNLR